MIVSKNRFRGSRVLGGVLVGLLWCTSAAAQDITGLGKEKNVSSGSTDVATEGFQAAAKSSSDKETKDSTNLKLMAGGILTSGNTRIRQLSVASDFQMRRSASQLGAKLAVNIGDSAADPKATPKATVDNYQGQLRYDHFFSKILTGFFSTSGRKDRFQSLVLRLNVDPGVAYYAIDQKNLKVWAELGYDFQYDIREDDAVDASVVAAAENPDAEILDKTEARHNGRLLVGYKHDFSEEVGLDSNLEYLQAIQDTENFRINGSAALTSQIAGDFSVSLSFTLRFDNNPLPTVNKTDTLSAFNLVYSF